MSSPSASGATKRPLEDSSSPNVRDEHDSKRPALDKEGSPVAATTEEVEEEAEKPSSPSSVKQEEEQEESTEEQAPAAETTKDDDTLVPDAPQEHHEERQEQDQDHQALQPQVDESQWIHIRALITSAEAATVIGKGGENVSQIRKMAEAKCTVSDYQRGCGERILTVSGAVDAVAKVGLIVAYDSKCVRYSDVNYRLSVSSFARSITNRWIKHPLLNQRLTL